MSLIRAVLVALCAAGAVGLVVPPHPGTVRLATVAGSVTPPSGPVVWLAGWRQRWHRRRGRARQATATAEAVVDLVEAMAAELRAGQPPPAALAAAVGSLATPVVPGTLVTAARDGGPVADLLDAAASAPGGAGLAAVAACWRVSERSGAGLARGLEAVAVALRDECDVVREIAGQLAAPRSTGRLLALLPLFGWLLGSSMGAHPLEVLLTTPYGWACIALGVPLQVAGWWWMERLAAAVDPWRR